MKSIEDDYLDGLFRKNLNEVTGHEKAEEQWAIVSSRLKTSSERRVIPLFVWGIGLLVLICFAGIFLIIQSSNNTAELHSESMQASDIVPAEIFISEKIEDINSSKEQIGSLLSSPTDDFILVDKADQQIAVPKVVPPRNSEKELCNCPDDEELVSSVKSSAHDMVTSFDFENEVQLQKEVESVKRGEIMNLSPLESITNEFIPRGMLSVLPSINLPAPNIQNKRKRRVQIHAGLMREFYSRDLSDSTSVSPYFGISWSFSNRVGAYVEYNQHSVDRTYRSGFDRYAFDPVYGIPLGSPLTYAKATYDQKTIDLLVNYKLVDKKVNLFVAAGTQFSAFTKGNLELLAEQIYLSEPIDIPILDKSLHLSKLNFGITMTYPFLNRLNIEMYLRRYFPIGSEVIEWGAHNKIGVGLTYKI